MGIDDGINGMFFLSVGTILMSGLTLIIRYCYKSKCKEVNLCCLSIKRDVDIEKEEDLQLNNLDSPQMQNINRN